MRTRRGARTAGSDGFTLLETLVAIAVVAAVSVALQRGFVSTRQALARAEAITAAEAVARDILENRLDELAVVVGVRRGDEGGVAFTVTSEPLALPFPPPVPVEPEAPAAAPAVTGGAAPQGEGAQEDEKPFQPTVRWAPLRVTIQVDTGSAAPLAVETVRLARAP